MSYTINPNAKNKWARNAENTMDLSLETDASSVYLDNGRTLEQELGEGSMVSNVTTVDTSMSKIIDGTLDGAYESGVMYGRSLVNLSNLHKSFNDVTLSDYYFDTSLCETSKLKLGTPYTLVFYTTVHGGDHDIYGAFELGVSNSLHSTNTHPQTTTNYWGTLVKNGWSKMCVTFTDFRGYKYLSLRPIRCHAPESGKSIRFSIKGFILLEGDWSNKDLPFNDYFEGICDVKMPILRNVGKNLFDVNLLKGLNSHVVVTDGVVTMNNAYSNGLGVNGRKVFDFLKPNKTYRYSCTVTNTGQSNGLDGGFYFGKRLTDGTTTYFSIYPNTTVTIPSDWDNYTIAIMYGAMNNNGLVTVRNMQFEESNVTTSYEDYKTNILRTSEEIVLREVNGIQDTYNPLTGEYVRRIGEIVLDGSDDESWDIYTNSREKTVQFRLDVTSSKGQSDYTKIISDWLPSVNIISNNDIEGISIYSNGKIYISLLRTKAETLSGLKSYLQSNPITVQYELAEPITTIVEPLTIPFAYQNGHIILESGSEEQSLLPTLEYSTVINKTGLVENVAKTIQRQEKQLTMLEQMLIQNIINLDYNNTLLALKNEMEEML